MDNFKMPIFCAGIVAFPGNPLNLHIFEERYKQLIHYCIEQNCHFGMALMRGNVCQTVICEMSIESIEATYPDGTMDVRCMGINVAIIEEMFQPTSDTQLFDTAIVDALPIEDYTETEDIAARHLLSTLLIRFYDLLLPPNTKVKMPYNLKSPSLSYNVGNKIGFTIGQEHELLSLDTEGERQDMIVNHLQAQVENLTHLESVKERIKLNGHFKALNKPTS